MPELPEVETTCNGIRTPITGQSITDVCIRNFQFRWPIQADMASILIGQKVISVTRRAKYILIELQQGWLILHLGMSGSLRLASPDTEIKKHDHVDISFSDTILRFNDPRRFGALIYTTENPFQHKLLSHLGPEPLSDHFNLELLFEICQKKKTQRIKNLIMDATNVVGVGNIYANEALFIARIHPLFPAAQLNRLQLEELVTAIKWVLERAIEQGGTTLKDFESPEGKPGYFKQELLVYGRKKQPCVHCKTLLEEIRIQNRSTVFCPTCQPEFQLS